MTGNQLARIAKCAPFVILALAVLLALPGTSYAQRFTAELSGVVLDESGGVVPGADVTLTNEASGAVRRSVTNADGFFAFAAVPAGTYKILVAIQGFNSFEVTGMRLSAGDSRTLREIKIKVATVAETVSVTAEVQLTPLNSGEKSATLSADVIENIPIVSSSAAELLRILPGMTPITQGVTNRPGFTGEVIGINGNGEYQGGGGNNQSAIGNFSANGTPTKSLDITLDGAPGADPGCNCATSVNPNTEFVQEFKVMQSSFGAEYSKGPNSMSVVTKSGGRDFHGSAFLYFRDYHLNSNEWYANKVGDPRIKNKFVYPGFTFSGPLTIGGFNKNRDKVFFFVGYEYYQQKLDTGYVRSWAPTQAMRNGDFSELPGLGLSGADISARPNFPGGIVPGSAIDPGGQILLNTLPLPNANPATTGGYNYVNNLLISQPNHQMLARLDFNISDNTKMFVRYNLQRETQDFVIGLWWRQNGQQQLPYPTAVTSPNASDSVTASITHVFDPTLTSETILAVTYIDFPNQFADRSKVSQSALGYPYNGIFTVPDQHIPGMHLGSWGSSGPNMWAPGGFDPTLFATKWQYAFTQNLTKVWGTHTAKAGFFFERITNNQPGSGWSNGFIITAPGWTSNSTGNSFSDLLTGRIQEYDQQTKQVLHNIGWNRFELFLSDSWKAKPSLTLTFGARASIFQPWSDRQGNGIVVWDQSRYASDVASGQQFPGVTWNKQDSSVPMTGVQTPFYVQPRIGFAWDVRGTGETVLRGGAGMYLWHDAQQPYDGLVDLSAGLRSSSVTGGTTLADVDQAASAGGLVFNGNSINVNDKKQPTTWNWSLSLNQKLPWSMNIELGYVGNSSGNLMNFNASNYNAVPLGAMLGNPDGDQNAYRPLSAYGDLNVYAHSLSSQYHGLQALLARQRGNFNYTLAYTFSKVVGYRGVEGGGPGLSEYILTPYRDYNYGVLNYDRTHVATGSFSYLLPEPKSGGVAKQILGGWQFAGILSYVAGAPLPYIATGNNFNMTGTGVDGVTLDARHIAGSPQASAQPVLTCNPAENVPSGYLINPACFSAPTAGANGSYNMPYMKAQSYFNTDLSLFKNFSMGGDRKLQFRINAYNVFNHPIAYPDPANNLTLSFNNGVLSSPNFGKLPEDNKFGRRIVQLAVRFTF